VEKEEGDAGPVRALAGSGLTLPGVGRDEEGHSEMRPRSTAKGNGQQASPSSTGQRRHFKGGGGFQKWMMTRDALLAMDLSWWRSERFSSHEALCVWWGSVILTCLAPCLGGLGPRG